METKQSSVDFIIKFCHKQMDNDTSIHKGVYLSIIKFCEQQAKEMHKQEIMNASDRFANSIDFTIEDFEQYYNETFGK